MQQLTLRPGRGTEAIACRWRKHSGEQHRWKRVLYVLPGERALVG